MSVYMTLSVSVERYISVIHPVHSRLSLSHSRYYYLYLASPAILLSIIISLPTYFAVETKCAEERRMEDHFNDIKHEDSPDFEMMSQVLFFSDSVLQSSVNPL